MKKLINLFAIITICVGNASVLSYNTFKNHIKNNVKSGIPNNLNTYKDYNWKQDEPNGTDETLTTKNNVISKHNFNLGKLSIAHQGSYMDYTKFLTGFQNDNAAHKQVPTGVPIQTTYLPNGNKYSDWGDKDPKTSNTNINNILNWSLKTDNDAKYNISNHKILSTKKVPIHLFKDQASQTKYLDITTLNHHTSAESSIVGSRNLYDLNFENYAYKTISVAWAGSAGEGIITPPASDAVIAAHKNGTKIFGNVFLDGYHGLTKEMLTSFLQKDSSGNYKIVNILINMAKTYGFDGWFINDEPNGGSVSFDILDEHKLVDIVKQLHNTISKSKDPNVQRLQIATYLNGSIDTYERGGDISQGLATYANYFVQDFYYEPADDSKWRATHPNYDSSHVFNISNLSTYMSNLGHHNYNSAIVDKNNKPVNSIANYAGQSPNDEARNSLGRYNPKTQLDKAILETVLRNNYEDMEYSGASTLKSSDQNGNYGIGDFVIPKTVLIDGNISNFSTNFSTGEGKKFVENNGMTLNNYVWTNRNLKDAQPTYKWLITDNQNKDAANSNLNGYYDYNTAYRKGNSVSLGSGWDDNGAIKDATFNKDVNWSVMGSNFKANNNNISMKIQTSSQGKINNNLANSNIIVTTADNKIHTLKTTVKKSSTWNTVSANLSSLNGQVIARIGVNIHANTSNNNFKYSLGQFRIFSNNSSNLKTNKLISNIQSDYEITRNNKHNFRLYWNSKINNSNIYYEIYLKNNNKYYRLGETSSNYYFIKNLTLNPHAQLIIKAIDGQTSSDYITNLN